MVFNDTSRNIDTPADTNAGSRSNDHILHSRTRTRTYMQRRASYGGHLKSSHTDSVIIVGVTMGTSGLVDMCRVLRITQKTGSKARRLRLDNFASYLQRTRCSTMARINKIQ